MNKEEMKKHEETVGRLRLELFSSINECTIEHVKTHLEEMKENDISIQKYTAMVLIDSLYAAILGSIDQDNKESINYIKKKFDSFVEGITKIYSKG